MICRHTKRCGLSWLHPLGSSLSSLQSTVDALGCSRYRNASLVHHFDDWLAFMLHVHHSSNDMIRPTVFVQKLVRDSSSVLRVRHTKGWVVCNRRILPSVE